MLSLRPKVVLGAMAMKRYSTFPKAPALLMLYSGLLPGQKCHSKVMHRKEVTHSNGSYERKSRGRKLADEMGRTGRERPLNCMKVISAWWRSNMWFQRSSGRSSGRWTIIKTQPRSLSWSSSRVGDGDRRVVVRKTTPGRRCPREPRWSLGTREDAHKMQ